jgi:hypothetical protein
VAGESSGGDESTIESFAPCSGIIPSISGLSKNADGSIQLTWCSDTNATYDIYYTENLVTQAWRLAAIQIPSQGTLTHWSDYGGPGRTPANVTARFYRVGSTVDSDGDGLPDAYELLVSNTATNLFDTNGNGIPDGEEDFDGDGVLNVNEYSLMTSPFATDSDGDGVNDGQDLFFDAFVKGKIRGDNQVGQAGQPLPIPFVVYLTNTNGAPVANGSNVTFTASSPSGSDVTSSLSNTSDTTGNNGFTGQAQTYLTFGSETGTYKVVAHCGGTDFEFHAETVTILSLEFTARSYQSSSLDTNEVIGDVANMRVTITGASTNVPHVIGVKLTSDANSSGIIAALTETASGSAVLVGSVDTKQLEGGSTMLLSLPSGSPNPVGGNSQDDGVAEYASADNAIESGSNWSDSETFDGRMDSDPFTARGKARAPLPIPQGTVKFSKSFLKAGGLQSIVIVAGTHSTTNWFQNQADFLYFSGHGFHDLNVIDTPTGDFSPSDVAGGEWKKDLEIVILAGCSVLDVTGDKWSSSNTNRPGRAWAKTGPTYLLGYEASAPGDSGGAPSSIVAWWYDFWALAYDHGDPTPSWGDANYAYSAWNAAAIDCSVSPKVDWHFTGTFAHTWTSVPENQW